MKKARARRAWGWEVLGLDLQVEAAGDVVIATDITEGMLGG